VDSQHDTGRQRSDEMLLMVPLKTQFLGVLVISNTRGRTLPPSLLSLARLYPGPTQIRCDTLVWILLSNFLTSPFILCFDVLGDPLAVWCVPHLSPSQAASGSLVPPQMTDSD